MGSNCSASSPPDDPPRCKRYRVRAVTRPLLFGVGITSTPRARIVSVGDRCERGHRITKFSLLYLDKPHQLEHAHAGTSLVRSPPCEPRTASTDSDEAGAVRMTTSSAVGGSSDGARSRHRSDRLSVVVSG